MISQIWEKVANNVPLSQAELAEFKMFGDRLQSLEAQMNGMTRYATSELRLTQPTIIDPYWETSPLHAFHLYRTTDLNPTVSTWTEVEFDTSYGENSKFGFVAGSTKKLKLIENYRNVSIDGIVDWSANTTGMRAIRINVYNESDVSLGTKELTNAPTTNSALIGLKQNVSYTERILDIVPGASYFVFEVWQNGGAVTVENVVFTLKEA